MAAPAHYIRTIHTSFTAAHPHSSTAWANAASVRTQHQYLHPFTSTINSHNSQVYQQHLQQHHNYQQQQQYQQHQQQLHHLQSRKSTTSISGGAPAPSPAGAGGRRRAGAIRMTPSSSQSSSYTKFDPFADEPLTSSPLTPSPQVNRISYTQDNTYNNNRDYEPHHHQQPPSITSRSAPAFDASMPITIHIPAAAPTEIKRYSTSPARRITNFTSSNTTSAGSRGRGGSTFLGGSTIPSAVPTLNPSKIVAGILLNRVHAVGKPMRRRMPVVSGPKQYVKSGLSSVVSIEA
jgi:hypothetical protein